MSIKSLWNQTKASTIAAVASAGLVATTAPEADAAIITLTGNATISSSDAALAGTDFEVGDTVSFDLDIDTDAVDQFPGVTDVGVYNDSIVGNVSAGSYEGTALPSDLFVIDNASSPSADIIEFSPSNGNLSSNITPNGNVVSGILFEFLADTGQYSGIDITNVNELPDFNTGSLEFVFNANTSNQINVVADVDFGTVSVVPEPGSAALLGLGGLAMMRRRRPKNTYG